MTMFHDAFMVLHVSVMTWRAVAVGGRLLIPLMINFAMLTASSCVSESIFVVPSKKVAAAVPYSRLDAALLLVQAVTQLSATMRDQERITHGLLVRP